MTERLTASQQTAMRMSHRELTSPVLFLSSEGAGWEDLVVRAYHEPMEIEGWVDPVVPDTALVVLTRGTMLMEQRRVNGSWKALPIRQGDLILKPGGSVTTELRWRSLSSEPMQTLHMHLNHDLFSRTTEEMADRDPARLALVGRSGFQTSLFMLHTNYDILFLLLRRVVIMAHMRELEMSKVVVFTNLTLDGVMQAPGRRDEDLRGGFQHGGWATPYAAMTSSEAGESIPNFGALLLGRRTYEDFYAYWPKQTDNPFTEVLNNMQKYVASTTLEEPLAWSNSTLLKGDVPEAVAGLKAQPSKDLVVMGSGELIQTLIKHNLVDRYVLLIHPLVLGSGRHLFAEGDAFAALHLVSAKATPNGVVVATYEPTESMAGKPT